MIRQILRNLTKCLKTATGGHFGGAWGGGAFGRFEGDQHLVAGRPHAIESLCKIKKKVIVQVLRNQAFK